MSCDIWSDVLRLVEKSIAINERKKALGTYKEGSIATIVRGETPMVISQEAITQLLQAITASCYRMANLPEEAPLEEKIAGQALFISEIIVSAVACAVRFGGIDISHTWKSLIHESEIMANMTGTANGEEANKILRDYAENNLKAARAKLVDFYKYQAPLFPILSIKAAGVQENDPKEKRA